MADVPNVIMETFVKALTQLKDAGAIVVDTTTNYTGAQLYTELGTKEKLLSQLTNFRTSMDDFLQHLRSKTCAIMQDPTEDFPHRDIELWKWALEASPDKGASKGAFRRDIYFAGEGGIVGVLERSDLDALVFPTTAKMSDHFAAGGGLPVITVPMGYLPQETETKWNARRDLVTEAPNKPFALGITGKAFSEPALIRIAAVFGGSSQVRLHARHYKLPASDFGSIMLGVTEIIKGLAVMLLLRKLASLSACSKVKGQLGRSTFN
ncbi:uncharacterized protein Z519_02220 [Cladophialophora bantiana CBS 173.52]|uniref:Amidase domain-containing protein n=1 Tax=Cladophialophora bantiana (strain ATCC 10958 / CBS 173.52 / CDC B-1940 / NIH 8579) TaxID=1442370 RepID=A0A0D2IJ71_CLAB1|nr:uncharacterized protein Z519_02220 [Cladophialophora bantiana CBS 173.52]KIW96829.1 hypothetical protein Z519_02220 [Cladophialophora bantiana CBS 173.52]